MRKNKNLNTSILLSLLLGLVHYIDWALLKGFFSEIIPVSLIYIVIGLIGYLERESLKKRFNIVWKFIKKNRVLFTLIVFSSLLVISFKGEINYFILNKNSFNLTVGGKTLFMHLKFIIKILLLIAASLSSYTLITVVSPHFAKIKERNRSPKNIGVFWLMFVFFIIVKLFFVFYYDGNYQDDWNHISAGKDFFDTFQLNKINIYFADSGYLRGSYVSVMVGLFFKIFGSSINVAQLVPFVIGVVNFLLLNKLLNKTIKEHSITLLFLFLYTITPYVIFNHLYIRMYVFYELFALVGIFWILKIYNLLRRKECFSMVINTISLISTYISLYILSSDRGYLFVLLVLGVTILYLYIFEANEKNKIKTKFVFINSIFNLQVVTKIKIAFGIFVASLGILLIFTDYLTSATNSETLRMTFIDRLLQEYWLYIVLGLFSLPAFFRTKSLNKRALSAVGIAIIVILYFLPDQFNLTRGLSMLFPIILVFAAIGLERISYYIKNKNILNYIALGLIYLTSLSYPYNFLLRGPIIPGEVAYYEFEEVFEYIHNDLGDRAIAYSTFNVIPNMYWGTDGEYIINIDNIVEGYYFPDDIRYINTLDELRILEKDKGICIFTKGFSYTLLLNDETIDYLESTYRVSLNTKGIDVLCSE